MTAAIVLPHLILARTKKGTDSVNKTVFQRLQLWNQGKLDELLTEAKALQVRRSNEAERHSQPLKSFTEFMKGGKIDKINDNANERAALKTKGSHGPSGLDSCQWRRLLTSFDKVSNNLRKTVAKLAYRIATEVLPSTSLEAYNNSWLIPLETSPGVRPIVIGEVLRQLTGRCISSCLGAEAKGNGGNIQLWLGQNAEIEHVIHALRKEFERDQWSYFTERSHWCLQCIKHNNRPRNYSRNVPFSPHTSFKLLRDTKPPFCWQKSILSRKGCTTGDPIAMLMNGVAIKSPILKLQKPKIVQNLYADIGNAVGSLQQLHEFFENLSNQGPRFGYHVNAPKCQLIVKPLTQQKAESIFCRHQCPNS